MEGRKKFLILFAAGNLIRRKQRIKVENNKASFDMLCYQAM